MRKTTLLSDNWLFTMEDKTETVSLPHCWNALDGNTKDYKRLACTYERALPKTSGKTFLYIEAANSLCTVEAEGKTLTSHKGGYSAFTTDVTEYANKGADIRITVDNKDYADVYPTRADFTFWGGLYRNVRLIETAETHFSFRDYSSEGVYITPRKSDEKWYADVKALIDGNVDGCTLKVTLFDKDGNVFAEGETQAKDTAVLSLECDNPILWNGLENPYLYTARCEIIRQGEVLDNIDKRIGFRTFYIDSEKGFFLNGNHLKLKGVCRHQDREKMGNGITEKEHKEDLDLILEVGANSIRLAHYQQSQYFYDLCDEKGILVWAEVPVISAFQIEKQENGKQQLCELIKQSYNHPCIFCWGIQNEITQEQSGARSKKLVPSMKELEGIVKALDSTRYSTCAQLSILDQESPLNFITDILGYNHYFGWYDFGFEFLNKWLDEFHDDFPQIKLCLSEYGAEGLTNLHSATPVQGDYSEEYQCIFHENYIKAINSRDWLWGSYVWNMFDFGAANRREGGVVGKNNKGLVTYDRKTRKDSFYLYKAYWTDTPFVHICGERFSNRVKGKADIKVYSNCEEITLCANGKEYNRKGDKIFIFKDIEITEGENTFTALSGDASHSITLLGKDTADSSYSLADSQSFVRNWAKKSPEESKNYLSPKSTFKELVKSEDAHIMVGGKLGKDYLKISALKLIYPVKIETALKIARKLGLSKNHFNLLTEYTYAIHK
ncbi:MAG: hypothetical protein IJ491_02210 [Clostridia bacterium]|nr:hypothetical protein [Clostridia bacterium]